MVDVDLSTFSGAAADLPMSCLTGNCTWPTSPTLGVCSDCLDATSRVEETCRDDVCQYSLPGGTTLSVPLNDFQPFPVFTSMPGNYSIFQNGSGLGTKEPDVPIVSIDLIAVSTGPWFDTVFNASLQSQNITRIDRSRVAAAQCGFWFCVKAIAVSVSLGTTTQTVLDQWSAAEAGTGAFDSPHDSNLTYHFKDIPDSFNTPAMSPYTVMESARLAFEEGIQTILTGDVVANLGKNWTIITSDGVESGVAIQSAWVNMDEIAAWMGNISTGLTNGIRQSGSPNSSSPSLDPDYAGTASIGVVVYKVRWYWLALPSLLVVVSILDLATTILYFYVYPMPIWKNSALATLQAVVIDEAGTGVLRQVDWTQCPGIAADRSPWGRVHPTTAA